MTWRSRAACLDENPELFFPIGNADPAFHQINKAKVICRRCEVADTCLRWAMHSHQVLGDSVGDHLQVGRRHRV
jgi:WhiB family transcriptional regulator, redox-sensing transcriptional regulator